MIYCSEGTQINTPELIKEILKKAQQTNKELHLSGVLFFNRKYFLQALEGDSERLNQIYHKIAADPRHKKLHLISYKKINARSFGDWNMGIASEKKVNTEVFYKYGMDAEFDPYLLESDGAQAFLKELSGTVKIFDVALNQAS